MAHDIKMVGTLNRVFCNLFQVKPSGNIFGSAEKMLRYHHNNHELKRQQDDKTAICSSLPVCVCVCVCVCKHTRDWGGIAKFNLHSEYSSSLNINSCNVLTPETCTQRCSRMSHPHESDLFCQAANKEGGCGKGVLVSDS